MARFIKIKNFIDPLTIYIPKEKVTQIRTNVDLTSINDGLIDEWYIEFFYDNSMKGKSYYFSFDKKEEVQEILKQLEE